MHIVYTNWVHTVAPDRQSAAYRLFHIYRRVLVQQLFTMNEKTLKEMQPTSGNTTIDADLRTEWVTVSLTAPEMCDYIKRGASLMFQNVKEATTLYVDLVQHLRGWLDLFDRNPGVKKVPLDDLRQFDELASMVFPYASRQLMAYEDDIGYGAFLVRAARRRRGLMAELSQEFGAETAPVRPAWRSLSDQIAERLAHRLGT
jgi:hypothetical protein